MTSLPPTSPYADLGFGPANHVALSPLTFLAKAERVHGDRPAIVYGTTRRSWRETGRRCRQLAAALRDRGIGRGDTVAILAPNVPAMVEAHFGVPMAGAVLNTLNTRLDAEALRFQLAHGEARGLLVDHEFLALAMAALAGLDRQPFVIVIDDERAAEGEGEGEGGVELPVGATRYDAFLAAASDAGEDIALPDSEFDPIALSYTSGTTGDPKGVVTHHRGAYLNTLSQLLTWSMPPGSVYLWTLPLFHCNGWCFAWALAAIGGVNVCLRKVDPPVILDLIVREGVTHMCGAPIVYSMLIEEAARTGTVLPAKVQGFVAGAPPPEAMLAGAEAIGLDITHVYGLTEVYGPAAVCYKQPEWDELPLPQRARRNARQGFAGLAQEDMQVLDPATLLPVPEDGRTVGEIMFRGNVTMSGYLKNPAATAASFADGWFHTGDLGVVEPDGYARIVDRSKDVIISGGENISSLEVEDALHAHPAVLVAAVVAAPDAKWGEVPAAFVELRQDAKASEDELIAFARERLAKFKVPKMVVIGPIDRTATGKVQKFALRARAAAIVGDMRITP